MYTNNSKSISSDMQAALESWIPVISNALLHQTLSPSEHLKAARDTTMDQSYLKHGPTGRLQQLRHRFVFKRLFFGLILFGFSSQLEQKRWGNCSIFIGFPEGGQGIGTAFCNFAQKEIKIIFVKPTIANLIFCSSSYVIPPSLCCLAFQYSLNWY